MGSGAVLWFSPITMSVGSKTNTSTLVALMEWHAQCQNDSAGVYCCILLFSRASVSSLEFSIVQNFISAESHAGAGLLARSAATAPT
jgi:hypothetical protein